MRKFEYKVVSFRKKGINSLLDIDELETVLTGEGLIGWEVVESFPSMEKGMFALVCYLMKREIISEKSEGND